MKIFGVTATLMVVQNGAELERYIGKIMGADFTISDRGLTSKLSWIGHLYSTDGATKYATKGVVTVYGADKEKCGAELEKAWSRVSGIKDWNAEKEYAHRQHALSERIKDLTERLQREQLQIPDLKKAARNDGVNLW